LGLACGKHSGSANILGIADRAIDGLIDRVVFADHREQLVAATRALNRALLWHHYVVPQWTLLHF
jgi:microcin C transport system substrate-binding protein